MNKKTDLQVNNSPATPVIHTGTNNLYAQNEAGGVINIYSGGRSNGHDENGVPLSMEIRPVCVMVKSTLSITTIFQNV